MKLLNALKSLSWNSLRRHSLRRPRLRRKSASWTPGGCFAAEVLEHRTLLSATVNLTTSATGAIQLTSNTDHGEKVAIGVHRNGANVEFIVAAGTLHDTNTNTDIGVGKTFDVALASIKSIAVNLGAGFDLFQINDLSTTGNVTFTGVGGGTQSADGWSIQIANDTLATADSTIGGSIVANLGTASGGGSAFNVRADSAHNLTIKGSISITDAVGSQGMGNQILTDGAGSLTVGGSVNITSSGAGVQVNGLDTQMSTGSLTVAKNVTINTSGTGTQLNSITTERGAGALTVGGAVSINSTGAAKGEANVVSVRGGDITLGSVAINSSAASEQANQLNTTGAGNLTVNKTVVIASTGAGMQFNQVITEGAGNITIGSATLKSSGAGTQFNALMTSSSGSLTVNGSAALNSSSTSSEQNELTTGVGSGNLTVNGNVALNSAGAGLENNSVVTTGQNSTSGNLLVTGNLSITASGDRTHFNELGATFNTGTLSILGSFSVNDSGNGSHTGLILSQEAGDLTVKGTVAFHDAGDGMHNHFIVNDGFNVSSGSIAVGAVSITDAGAGEHDDEIATARKGGTVTVNGSTTVVDTGTGANLFFISAAYSHLEQVYGQGGGSVQINGNVSYDNHLNTTNGDTVGIGGDLAEKATTTISGGVTLNLANAAAHGNVVDLGLLLYGINGHTETGKSLIIGGSLNVQSGAGVDQINLWAVLVKGLLTLNSGLGTGDAIDIESSEFDGAASTGRRGAMYAITMSGDTDSLFIADFHSHGWDSTFFAAGVQCNMPGAATQGTGQNDVIQIGHSGDGVTFNQQLFATGATPKTPGGISGTVSVHGPVTFKLNGVAQSVPVVTHWNILSTI